MPMDPLAPIRLTTAYFILFCVSLHLFTAGILACFPEAGGSTTVSETIAILGGTGWAAVGYATAATCAMLAMKTPFPWNVLLLLPQQAILILASVGIGIAIVAGQFADGVPRPRMFIFQDHIELPLITAFHAGVLIMRAALTSRLGPGLFLHPLEKIGVE